MTSLPLDKNPNWKGGKAHTSHGYITVLMPTHPKADSNGYIYEHRLVAEQLIGRQLDRWDIVHHKNGNKQDNRPENILVTSGNAEHKAYHRRANRNLRQPEEPNSEITCACGCGLRFLKYDGHNRPRRYARNHNHWTRRQ